MRRSHVCLECRRPGATTRIVDPDTLITVGHVCQQCVERDMRESERHPRTPTDRDAEILDSAMRGVGC